MVTGSERVSKMDNILTLEHVNSYYGKVQALHDISISIGRQEIVSVIGANGAGKSTMMKTIMNLVHAPEGKIIFDGQNLVKMRTHNICKAGIAYVPEGRDIFPDLTVQENLEMGAYSRNYSASVLNGKMEEVCTLFPRLKERYKQKAGCMSGGEQQMLAIARGLMSDTKLVMLDEPSLGLAPVIVDDVFDIIVRINRDKGIPIV